MTLDFLKKKKVTEDTKIPSWSPQSSGRDIPLIKLQQKSVVKPQQPLDGDEKICPKPKPYFVSSTGSSVVLDLCPWRKPLHCLPSPPTIWKMASVRGSKHLPLHFTSPFISVTCFHRQMCYSSEWRSQKWGVKNDQQRWKTKLWNIYLHSF